MPSSAECSRVLLLAAEASVSVRSALVGSRHILRECTPNHDALPLIGQFEPRVVVAELADSGDDERLLGLLSQVRCELPYCSVLVIAPDGERLTAALQVGADAVLSQATASAGVLWQLERCVERAQLAEDAARFSRRAEETLSLSNFDAIIGSHPLMQALLKKVAQVAQSRATVLITGESGTGKELIAAAIHQNSKRKLAPFVRLNCSALADSLLESELFGHEKGAFTGALARREGRFKQADNGTLFLDEVSELPQPTQVRLLRFLQEREFERVGGNETLKVDVRIVAASNRELLRAVGEGKFREDLYYRLNVVRLEVPPLRERPSDILQLADHFMRRACADNEVQVLGLTEAARSLLLEYPWPGNVRELQNTIEQAVVMCERDWVDVADLPLPGGRPGAESLRLMVPGASMEEIEKFAIVQTLKAVKGSTTRAAEILGISRRTVQYRVKEWGLGHLIEELRESSAPPPERAEA